MNKEILIDTLMGETRLALLEDGELAEFYCERRGQEKLSGNIYAGLVENVLPGMNAAFVDIGLRKNAFLCADDILPDARGDAELESRLRGQRIEKAIKKGQQVLVQVIKEPGGSKGPRVSNHVTLPGRKLVLLPTMRYAGVSKRIGDESERGRLRRIAESLCNEAEMGLIVRTAAEGATEDELRQECRTLCRLWEKIANRGSHSRPPQLIHMDGSLPYRAVRDMLDVDTLAVRTDDPEIAGALRSAAGDIAPEWADRIELYTGQTPLFDLYRVDSQVEKALDKQIWLKSGGYLVIDETEALTVVDVNTGKFVGKQSLSETIFRTNQEAAAEIARQIRLRDVGGIVVIDFIDMELPEQRDEVLKVLRESLKSDRNRTNVVGFTGLGLVEMTRKKVRQPLLRQMYRQCSACGGTGMILSAETAARKVLREICRRREAGALLATVSAEVAAELESIGVPVGVQAYVSPDPARHGAEYDISPADLSNLPKRARQLPQKRNGGE